MSWKDLTPRERKNLMQIYYNNGITSLKDMKTHYNEFSKGGYLFQNGGDKGKKKLPKYDYRQQMLDASMIAGMNPYTSETTRYDDTYADYEAERRKEALEEAQKARQKAADQREWERKQAKEAAKRQARWATEAEKKRWEDQRRREVGSVAGDALFGPRQQNGRELFQGEFSSWTPEQQQNYIDVVEASGKKDQLINTTQRDLEIMADRYGQALGSAAPMPVEAAVSNPVTAAAAGAATYMAGLGLYEAAPYVWKGVKTAVRNPMSILETAGKYMSPSTYTNALGFSPMVGNIANSAMALEIGKQSLQNLPKDAEAMTRGKDGSAIFRTGMDVLGLLPYYSMFKQVDGALNMMPRRSSNMGIVPPEIAAQLTPDGFYTDMATGNIHRYNPVTGELLELRDPRGHLLPLPAGASVPAAIAPRPTTPISTGSVPTGTTVMSDGFKPVTLKGGPTPSGVPSALPAPSALSPAAPKVQTPFKQTINPNSTFGRILEDPANTDLYRGRKTDIGGNGLPFAVKVKTDELKKVFGKTTVDKLKTHNILNADGYLRLDGLYSISPAAVRKLGINTTRASGTPYTLEELVDADGYLQPTLFEGLHTGSHGSFNWYEGDSDPAVAAKELLSKAARASSSNEEEMLKIYRDQLPKYLEVDASTLQSTLDPKTFSFVSPNISPSIQRGKRLELQDLAARWFTGSNIQNNYGGDVKAAKQDFQKVMKSLGYTDEGVSGKYVHTHNYDLSHDSWPLALMKLMRARNFSPIKASNEYVGLNDLGVKNRLMPIKRQDKKLFEELIADPNTTYNVGSKDMEGVTRTVITMKNPDGRTLDVPLRNKEDLKNFFNPYIDKLNAKFNVNYPHVRVGDSGASDMLSPYSIWVPNIHGFTYRRGGNLNRWRFGIMKWEDLSIKDKSELIKSYVKGGITSLDIMKKHYNSFGDGGHLFAGGGSPLTKAISKYISSGKSFDDILSENAMFARNFSPEQIDYARKWYNKAKMKPRKKSKEELDWEWERGRTREQREYRNNQLSKLAEREKRAGTNPLLWPIETNVTPYEAAKIAMPDIKIPTQSQQKAHSGEIRDWYKYSPSQQAGMQNALLGANNAYAMTPDLTYNTYTATGQVYKGAAEMGLLFAGLPYAGKVIDAVGNPTTTIIKAGSKILPNAEKLLGIANGVDRIYNGYLTYDGIRNLVSDNGVQKTYKLIKQRDYGKAFKSGAGDVLDIFGSVPINYLKYLKGMKDFRINESNKIINEIEDFAEAFNKQAINNSNRPAIMNSYFRPSKLKIGEIVTPKKYKDMGYDLMGTNGINYKGYYYIPSYRPGEFMHYGTKERGVLAKKGLIGHEQQHSWQQKSNILDENSSFPLTQYDLSESYYFFANPEHPLYKSSLHYLDKNKQKAGWKESFFPKSWMGSPDEVDSEMMRFRVMLDKDNDIYKNIQYYKWPKELKEKAIKQISKRFSLKPRETTKLLYDMSTFGYF